LWALLVVYGGTGGLHHHLYLLSPERGWLWHLNSGQVLATDDSTAGVDKHGNTALHHAATRLKVDSQTLRDDWAAWTRRPDFQPLGLADWYRRHWADRSSLAVLVFVVECFCSSPWWPASAPSCSPTWSPISSCWPGTWPP